MRDAVGSAVDLLPSLLDRIGPRIHTFDERETILLASVPRTGSTWVMNLLAHLPGYKPVFEPMDPRWYAGADELGLGPRPRVPADGHHPGLEAYLSRAFAGQATGWLRAYSPAPSNLWTRLTADKLVVKSVRLTRSLAWITETFDLRNVYLLVRHPCAVVASQLRTGIRGHFTDPETALAPEPVEQAARDALGDELTSELDEGIASIDTQAGLLALEWAVDYAIPLREGIEGVDVVRYEDLLGGGRAAVEGLFEPLGVDVPPGTLEAYGLPSHTTRGEVTQTRDEQEARWTDELDPETGERVLEIVGWLGFDQFAYDSTEYAFPAD